MLLLFTSVHVEANVHDALSVSFDVDTDRLVVMLRPTELVEMSRKRLDLSYNTIYHSSVRSPAWMTNGSA